MPPSSAQKPSALLRRPGFWILLFLLLACGFLLAGSLLRPWRLLQSFPVEGKGWQPGLPTWEAGPLTARGEAGELRMENLALLVDPLALLGIHAYPELRIDGLLARLEDPERARQLAYLRLRPEALPVQQILVDEARVEVADGNTTTLFRLVVEGQRNEAGSLEATGQLQGGGVRGQFLARLGWGALEDVVTFRGDLHPRTPSRGILRKAPLLQSLLRSRPEEAFPLEATLYLGGEWRLAEAVLLLGNARGHPPLTAVLEGQPAEGFSFRLAWEGGPRRPGWRGEARGTLGGPVSLRIRGGPEAAVWHLDATEGWRDGAPARLSRGGTFWEGRLRERQPAGWAFVGRGAAPFAGPLPAWPRFLEVHAEAS